MINVYYRIKQILFLFFCAVAWQGCNVINPVEQIPTYIHIDSFTFDNCRSDVSASHNITSVAVYYNNSSLGIFDLPCTVPIMATGSGNLQLAPGVAVNGLNSTIIIYPFYRIDVSTFTAQPGKTITHIPHTCYYNETKISKYSDFTGNVFFARSAGNKDLLRVSDPSLTFEGGTGSILLSAVYDSSIDSSTVAFPVPTGGFAFIEFNYKTQIPFYVGLGAKLGNYVSAEPYFLAGLKPTTEWKKFYLNVADFHAQFLATSYSFYIKAVLEEGQASGRLLIDNVQLVTF